MATDELEIWKTLNECECVNRVFGAKDWVLNMIPLFDPIRPERSLMGIAKSVKLHENRKYDLKQLYYPDRPDLALAKAIIEQEGK